MSKKEPLFTRSTPIAEELIDDKPTHQEQQIEQNIKKIFSSEQSQKANYIANLKSLYITFDQLSNQISNQNATLGLSQDEKKALESFTVIKNNLFDELSKFEKIKEEDLKAQNPVKNNAIGNLSDDNFKNLQLYLDEAKFITANLTEALDYDEKINLIEIINY